MPTVSCLVCVIGVDGERGDSGRGVRYSSPRQKPEISELTASWACLFFTELYYGCQTVLENRQLWKNVNGYYKAFTYLLDISMEEYYVGTQN